MTRHRLIHRSRVASIALAASLVLAACSYSPGVSNGSVSVCFRALPVGWATIHDGSAKLIGVHRIDVDKVRGHLPANVQDQLAAENDTSVCAMAFHGTFTPGQVSTAAPDQSGNYALVLVSSKKLHLVAAFVLPSLPRGFGGRTI